MKPRFYLLILLLLIPFQASLFNPLSLAGIRPDLALAVVYIIGLLTGPEEAVLAGVGIGILQDIGSAGLIGLSGFTRGAIGLLSGFLGRRVLDISSPFNIIFLAAFSLFEAIFVSLFMQAYYGSVPFFSMVFTRMLPEAFYTGLLGTVMLRLMNGKDIINMLVRRSLQKE